MLLPKDSEQSFDRIVEFVYHALLQRNDGVIRDCDTFRTNLGTTFRDIAIPNPLRFSELLETVLRIERMHFERGHINEKPRPDKFLMLLMFPENVANILTQKALNTLSKFLDAVDIFLLHAPASVRHIGLARLEFFDLLLDPEIP